jgi:putative nucleotidyltransferase with HDIG domain
LLPSGESRWMVWVDRGIFDDQGQIIEVQSVGRDIHEQKVIEDALRNIAIGVSAEIGGAFFRSLVDQLVKALGADYAFVGELIGKDRKRIGTIAVNRRGQEAANFSYDLDGTPCQMVVGRSLCVYPSNVQGLFPNDKGLAKMSVQAYIGAPLFDSTENPLGLLVVMYEKSLEKTEMIESILRIFATRVAAELERSQVEEALMVSNVELARAYDTTLEGWARALELRDRETEGHSRRVTELTIELARRLGVDEEDLVHIHRGALLHDIGKMAIPDEILQKSEELTEDEWVIMRQHPSYAYELLSDISFLEPALDIPYCHHEKWDGSGYPRGLKDGEIPLAARIFSVVDVWDALLSDRPYRGAWAEDTAIEYLRAESGKYFDPQVVATFLEILNL